MLVNVNMLVNKTCNNDCDDLLVTKQNIGYVTYVVTYHIAQNSGGRKL